VYIYINPQDSLISVQNSSIPVRDSSTRWTFLIFKIPTSKWRGKLTLHTYEWVITHIWMSHNTHMNESWHTYEWVPTHMNEYQHRNDEVNSRYTYRWVITHIWMSHDTHMNESCHSSEWVVSHIWKHYFTLFRVYEPRDGEVYGWNHFILLHITSHYSMYTIRIARRRGGIVIESLHITWEYFILLHITSHYSMYTNRETAR